MLLFIILLLLAIGFAFLIKIADDNCWAVFFPLSILVTAILIVAVVIMGIAGFCVKISTDATIARSEQVYESLVYQLENDIYENDNDLGKKELYDAIQSWNADLAEGRVMQDNVWVGMFYTNMYDQFEFIDLDAH